MMALRPTLIAVAAAALAVPVGLSLLPSGLLGAAGTTPAVAAASTAPAGAEAAERDSRRRYWEREKERLRAGRDAARGGAPLSTEVAAR